MSTKNRERINFDPPPDPSDQDDDVFEEGEIHLHDKQVEDRIADFIAQDKSETAAPSGTLYRLLDPKGQRRKQIDYFTGLIPSRHEIGLMYGGGYYQLNLTVRGKGDPRSTTYRFELDESYNDKKKKREEDEARQNAVIPAPGAPQYPYPYAPAISPDRSFKDALLIAQAMMKDTMAMFAPVIDRALSPQAAPAHGDGGFKDQLGAFSALRQVLRENAEADMSFFQNAKRRVFNMRPDDIEDEFDQAPPEEKKSIVERLLALAEPFIPLLSQNNKAAQLATAGIRSMPQVKGIIDQVKARPDAIKLAAEIVQKRYGQQEAINLIRNFGLNPAGIVPGAAPQTPQQPAKRPIKKLVLKKKP